jgi:small subunit ribosomal protein S1
VNENPWDNLEDVFAVGSSHTGNVKSTADKGFNIWFPNQEIEAYCPPRHASKEDNSSIAVGEELEFRVIEFNRDSRRILVSHTQSFKGGVAEEASEAGAKTTVQSINAQVEKATLGDLDSLARLKEEMEGKE